jgi:hypothetical protein
MTPEPDGERFPAEFYAHRVGAHDGTIRPPSDRSSIEDVRSVLSRLEAGDRVVFGTRTGTKQEPLRVTGVHHDASGTSIGLRGQHGGRYRIEDGSGDRPRVLQVSDSAPDGTAWKGGELWTLLLVGGETGPEVKSE